ncbi:ATP-binding protein [Candidatus Nomurabacteria bacterium]|nr:ATP-binding protein [Candidatus Nomurabacteria bacterium]MCB9819351.1 ATP-binding protein [Candidatus Nomurabacteria bacterium]
MQSNIVIDPTYCGWDQATLLIFSENVFGNFIYYSHLFPAIAILILAAFVFLQNWKLRANRALLFMAVVFSIWSFFDLILWATEKPEFTMFFWSILIYFDFLIYVGALYFIYAFVEDRYPSVRAELVIFALFVPLLIFAHTSVNLTGYDYTNCYREALEGPLWQYYLYNVEILVLAWILIYGLYKAHKVAPSKRTSVRLATFGITAFLFLFSLGNILGSFEVDWELGQYGLFGMPVFAGFLTYLIVRYNALNVKILATQALITTLVILNVSILFIRKVENIQIIAVATVLLTLGIGFVLARSVKREVEQKQLAQQLATELAGVNVRLERLDKMKSEFVSIASHQLRSPLTSVRGYISMIIEGSYGEVNPKVKEVLTHVSDASRHMALSIEDYLNVSRIEAGNMKYEIADYDLKKLANEVVVELVPVAEKKGIKLEFKPATEEGVAVKLDIGKSRQIVQNLIDNALKYTKDTGTITVVVRKDKEKKKAYVDVIDQGIGISPEGLKTLFQKFERAKNANEINVTGTGLGLYIARTMANGMGGDITVASEGEGKGSTFTFVMPLNGIEAKWT